MYTAPLVEMLSQAVGPDTRCAIGDESDVHTIDGSARVRDVGFRALEGDSTFPKANKCMLILLTGQTVGYSAYLDGAHVAELVASVNHHSETAPWAFWIIFCHSLTEAWIGFVTRVRMFGRLLACVRRRRPSLAQYCRVLALNGSSLVDLGPILTDAGRCR